MAKSNPALYALNGGEIDGRTQARADLDVYPRTADVLENIFASMKGGIAKAPGTQFIAECPESTVVLARSFYYASVKYMLELSDEKMRFVLGDGLVLLEGADATIGSFTDESAAPPTGGDPPTDGGSGGVGNPIGGGSTPAYQENHLDPNPGDAQ